ncbi:hypothetical protein AB1Y20_013202 [Prymnesium parvum]|uniref:Uncharacterized protein n=1 Tax=Prymnesium parvum TaxID=97485 RepID=A0AB34IMN5_PRYPA
MAQATFPSFGSRSTFGAQQLSRRKSSPQYGFGSSTREDQQKVFVSQEHASLNVAYAVPRSPGPAKYEHRPAVGPQVNGRIRSAPMWRFGEAERFSGPAGGSSSPGPAAYSLHPSIGPQAVGSIRSLPKWGFGTSTREHQAKVYTDAKRAQLNVDAGRSPGPAKYDARGRRADGSHVSGRIKTPPAWGFGKGARFNHDDTRHAAAIPGPGAYPLPATVGPQLVGLMPSSPAAGFGTSTRQHHAKVYQSHEHEKYTAGDSPGPAMYSFTPAFGKQTTSRRKSSSAWGFGTEDRFDRKRSGRVNVPGPVRRGVHLFPPRLARGSADGSPRRACSQGAYLI